MRREASGCTRARFLGRVIGAALALAGAGVCLPAASAQAAPALFKVGAATATINPTYPVYMGGFGGGPAGGTIARHVDPVTGRHEDFTVRAISIAAGGRVVEFATVDTQGYFAGYQEGPYGIYDVRHAVARYLAEHGVSGASEADVMIASEHEHASPTLLGIWGPPQQQLPYLRQVASALTSVLERAFENARSATITWGSGNAPWVSDRVIAEGNAFEGWPRDGSLAALWARDARSGKTIATFVSDPGYPNIVYGPGDLLGDGPGSAVLSSDFPNYADEYIASRLGGVAIVTDGTLGNQTSALQADDAPSPDLPPADGLRQTRAFDDIVHMGRLFAELTFAALARGRAVDHAIVNSADQYLSSPVYNPILLADDQVARLGGGDFFTAVTGGQLYPTDRSFEPPYGDGAVSLSTWVTAFRIGDLLFTSMPGEFFPSTHAAWTHGITGPAGNFVVGAAQDFLGYEYPVSAYPFTLEGSDEGFFNPSLTLGDQVVTAGEQDAQALGFHADLTSTAELSGLDNEYLRFLQPGVQFIPFPQSGDLSSAGSGFAPTLEGISQPPRYGSTVGVCLADTLTACPFPPPPMGPFRWSFGDGRSAVTAPQSYARAYYSPFVAHRYCTAGTYLVTVAASDQNGGSDNMSLPVTVYPALSVTVVRRGDRLVAIRRGGSGSLLYVHWRAAGRDVYGPGIPEPRRPEAVTVTAVDGTGTMTAVRFRYAAGAVRAVRTVPARAPALADAGGAGPVCRSTAVTGRPPAGRRPSAPRRPPFTG